MKMKASVPLCFHPLMLAVGFLCSWLGSSASLLAVSNGDRVQLTSGTIVRSSAAGQTVGTQTFGAQGGVIAGPALGVLNGVAGVWWDVNFDTGVDGWVQDGILTVILPPAPVLTSPGSSTPPGTVIFTNGPTLSWSLVNGATNYGVYVRDVVNNYYVFSNDAVGNASSVTLPPGTVLVGGNYYWFARAQDSAGFGPYAVQLYFQVQIPPPAAPVLIAPGAAVGPGPVLQTLAPVLSWNPSAAATNYGVYIYDIAAHAYIYYDDATGPGTIFNLPAGVLNSGTSYRWQARASNSAGFSAYSLPLYFQTEVAPPTLHLTLSGTNLLLAWPTNSTGFTLELTTSLPPSSWFTAAPLPIIWNTNFVVTNSAAGSPRYYRLRKSQ